MEANHFDVYAKFLLDCKKAMGTLDLDALAHDEEYKAEVFKRIAENADDELFEMASLVSTEIEEESSNH